MSLLSLKSNIASQRARRRLDEADLAFGRALSRLSSGMRINRAADDAAGLAVALGLGVNSRVFGQALRNGNDGISLLSVVDGALSNLSNITQRQLELAEQAANGSLTASQRRSLQQESNSLTREYNRILQSTTFNDTELMRYGLSPLTLQMGFGTRGSISFDRNYDLSRIAGAGTFTQTVDSPTFGGSSGQPIMAVDWNGDGKMDLVSFNNIALGDGAGGFTGEVSLGLRSAVGVADMNGDGRNDLIVQNNNGTLGTYILRPGSQQFVSSSVAANTSMKVGDFNGDGVPDVGVLTAVGNLSIAYGTSSGSFTSGPTGSFSGVYIDFNVGDVNGDGRDDIVARNSVNSNIDTILASSEGAFSRVSTSSAAIGSFELLDYDNDGRDDLVTMTSGTLTLWTSSGNGTFTATKTQGFKYNSMSLKESHDMNGDGLKDLIFMTSTEYGALLIDSNGTFTLSEVMTLPYASDTTMSAADMNGDGINDLVLNDFSGGEASFIIALHDTTRSTDAQFVSLQTQLEARAALTALQAQLERINLERGRIGSIQSRVDSALRTVEATAENLTAARSRILDADVASESAELARFSILRNSATAVLAQANQIPSLTLQLLRDSN